MDGVRWENAQWLLRALEMRSGCLKPKIHNAGEMRSGCLSR